MAKISSLKSGSKRYPKVTETSKLPKWHGVSSQPQAKLDYNVDASTWK
jgi:hypothetical protein